MTDSHEKAITRLNLAKFLVLILLSLCMRLAPGIAGFAGGKRVALFLPSIPKAVGLTCASWALISHYLTC